MASSSKCKKCGEIIDDKFDQCWKCAGEKKGRMSVGEDVSDEVAAEEEDDDDEGAFKHLNGYVAWLKVFGDVAFFGSIATAVLGSFFLRDQYNVFVLVFFSIALVVLGWMTKNGFRFSAESVEVIIKIENNTRRTADILEEKFSGK